MGKTFTQLSRPPPLTLGLILGWQLHQNRSVQLRTPGRKSLARASLVCVRASFEIRNSGHPKRSPKHANPPPFAGSTTLLTVPLPPQGPRRSATQDVATVAPVKASRRSATLQIRTILQESSVGISLPLQDRCSGTRITGGRRYHSTYWPGHSPGKIVIGVAACRTRLRRMHPNVIAHTGWPASLHNPDLLAPGAYLTSSTGAFDPRLAPSSILASSLQSPSHTGPTIWWEPSSTAIRDQGTVDTPEHAILSPSILGCDGLG